MGLCERCKKAQQTFHLTDIDRQGNKTERNLCDNCAKEEGYLPSEKVSFNSAEFMEQFVSSHKSSAGAGAPVCTECGMSYVEFRNHGMLGCPRDYDVFREPLARLIERAHNGATHHRGKTPASLSTAAAGQTPSPRKSTADLAKLRRMLSEAIGAEDYERAAKLRDRIRALENS